MSSPQEIKEERGEALARLERRVLSCGQTEVAVLPHGAHVASFKVGEIDVLFPDQMVGSKRRGGIPFLFPQGGPLTEEQSLYDLSQHGFARGLPWEIKAMAEGESTARIILGLQASEGTQAQFPHDFGLGYEIRIEDGLLRCSVTVANHSRMESMPIAPGWHPYFRLPVDQRPNLRTNIPGFDPGNWDWKSPLILPGQRQAVIEVPGVGVSTLTTSPNFRSLVIWSVPELPVLCVEPWTGPVNALLYPEQRIDVSPGETEDFYMEIRFTPEGENHS